MYSSNLKISNLNLSGVDAKQTIGVPLKILKVNLASSPLWFDSITTLASEGKNNKYFIQMQLNNNPLNLKSAKAVVQVHRRLCIYIDAQTQVNTLFP